MSTKNIALRNVRFNWLQVLEPSAYQKGDAERYRAEVIIEPGSGAEEIINAAVSQAASDKWNDRGEGMLDIAKSNGKCCLKVGDKMPKNKTTFELPEHYKGNLVLSTGRVLDRDGPLRVFCKNKETDALVEVNKDTDFGASLVRPVPGNYGDVMISVWGFEFGGSPQINCTLEAIAFTHEGDPLGGREAVTDDAIANAFGGATLETAEGVFAN